MEPKTFLGLFIYESISPTAEGNLSFNDCTLLKDINPANYQEISFQSEDFNRKGDHLDNIVVGIQMYGWHGDDLVMDEFTFL
jgi:hypothetical protein